MRAWPILALQWALSPPKSLPNPSTKSLKWQKLVSFKAIEFPTKYTSQTRKMLIYHFPPTSQVHKVILQFLAQTLRLEAKNASTMHTQKSKWVRRPTKAKNPSFYTSMMSRKNSVTNFGRLKSRNWIKHLSRLRVTRRQLAMRFAPLSSHAFFCWSSYCWA